MHREAVHKSFTGGDAAETEARHAVHCGWRAHAVPVNGARLIQAVGNGKRERVALAPAQNWRGDLAVDAGRRSLPAVDGQRHGTDLELKFPAAENRRRRGKQTT